MATLAPPELSKTADEWEDLADYPSAICSGIVGDLAHKNRGGYHISIEDQPSTNYSVVRPDDKAPPGNWRKDFASAIDMNLSEADMKKCHTRIRNVWKNRDTDPRAKYFNAWNGWDGQGDAGRYSFVTGAVETATSDHKWHIHMEVKRKYANDPNMRKAWISIVKGETVEQYLGETNTMTAAEVNDIKAHINTQISALRADLAKQFSEVAAEVWNTKNPSKVVDTRSNQQILGDVGNSIRPALVFPASHPENKGNVALAAGSPLAAVLAMPTLLKEAIAGDASRDAQDAARDAGLLALVEQLVALAQQSGQVALTAAQYDDLKTFLAQKMVEAGQDAADATTWKLNQIAEALDNAGQALSSADDEQPAQP